MIRLLHLISALFFSLAQAEISPPLTSKSKVLTLMTLTKEDRFVSREFIEEQMLRQMKAITQQDPDTKRANKIYQNFSADVSQKISDQDFENFKNDIYDLYLKTYTDEELDALIAFYKTKVGQSIVNKSENLSSNVGVHFSNLISKAVIPTEKKSSSKK